MKNDEVANTFQAKVQRNFDAQADLFRKSGEPYFAFANGLTLLRHRQYENAINWFRMAADKGHADAQTRIGLMYGEGLGVAEDEEEAVKWYRLSADQGNARGQYCLGWAYANGAGVTQDYMEGVVWYRLSADQGYEEAQDALTELLKQLGERQKKSE